MAGWEEELSVLLGELGVKQEETRPQLQQTQQIRKPRCSDTRRREQLADALLWGADNTDSELTDTPDDEDDPWIDDLDMMRREVDAIIGQVVLLMQRGDMDVTLKEDVMVVLRALRRRIPNTQQSSDSDEVYLESASAMLHFCRLVLQLSEFTTEDI